MFTSPVRLYHGAFPGKPLGMISTSRHALAALDSAWGQIISDCRQVLGSELHYQAIVYHALRTSGSVPLRQIGMNVKQYLPSVSTDMFRDLAARKQPGFNQGFEPIPDVVIFSEELGADWRRRNASKTLRCMLLAIEIKASERAASRLTAAEIRTDILKLAAHREEVRALGADFLPVMMVIDTAPDQSERMTERGLAQSRETGMKAGVQFRYFSADAAFVDWTK